jgi:hypothetical protein
VAAVTDKVTKVTCGNYWAEPLGSLSSGWTGLILTRQPYFFGPNILG